MTQPIDTSPPWWDGTIAIAFSLEEWGAIINELRYLEQRGYIQEKYNPTIFNIMDRIEKGIGVE